MISPLAALDLVIQDISNLPEKQRSLLENATRRIHDIANNLLFYQPDKFINWIKKNDKKNIRFFVDYELLGYSNTGLDIIKQMDIISSSFLITSHYDEVDLQKRCEAIKLKIIPKRFAAYIPIKII